MTRRHSGRLLRALLVAGSMALALSAPSAATRELPLIDAVKRGDAGAVKALLAKRAPVDAAEADGTTALHWAARAEQVDIAALLLKAGARANTANRYGVSPLTLAATAGNAPLTSLLLDAGADARGVSLEGEPVLMTAARGGSAAVVKALLDRGADANVRERWLGETPLMWAAAENHAEVTRLLLARGADANALTPVIELPKVKVDIATMVITALPRGGLSALMLAARQGAAEAVRTLADGGADLDLADPDGTTALNIAIINAHYDVAALLLEKGANPNRGDASGMTPLYATIDMRHQEPLINRPLAKADGALSAVDLVERLLAHGADPNQALTAPLLARQHNFGDAALGAGATPLMRAAKAGDAALMRLLIGKGADASRRLKNGGTAATIAVRGRRGLTDAATLEVLALCFDNGVDVNAASDTGETVLHAAVGRSEEVVKFLLARGARPDARDKFGRTPLDVALGVPGGAGRGGRPPEKGPVYERVAALLRPLTPAAP